MQSNSRTWRMIGVTAVAATVCWLVSLVMLRALAQEAPQVEPSSNQAEEVQRRNAPPQTADEESPEYRDSADNNISLPIDI